ncbi:MAG: hypothetical protein N2Z62_03015 [Rhodobacteraceae bacterium]|nr:hypothetical protein [Paracoccaceae bacterium]
MSPASGIGFPARTARLAGLAAALAAALGGCVETPPADLVARAAAKEAVRPVLQRRLPGVPLEPAVTCVIDNASAGEILRLARAGAAGTPDPATVDIVIAVLGRQGTIDCLATDGLAPFLR